MDSRLSEQILWDSTLTALLEDLLVLSPDLLMIRFEPDHSGSAVRPRSDFDTAFPSRWLEGCHDSSENRAVSAVEL